MTELDKNIPKRNTPCGGSGQSSFFAGASRFMLTDEDCPDCCITGVVLKEKNSTKKRIQNLPSSENVDGFFLNAL